MESPSSVATEQNLSNDCAETSQKREDRCWLHSQDSKHTGGIKITHNSEDMDNMTRFYRPCKSRQRRYTWMTPWRRERPVVQLQAEMYTYAYFSLCPLVKAHAAIIVNRTLSCWGPHPVVEGQISSPAALAPPQLTHPCGPPLAFMQQPLLRKESPL